MPGVLMEPTASLHDVLRSQQYAFLTPTAGLHTSLVELAKSYLDPLASDVTASQHQRLLHERQARSHIGRKRKRRRSDDGEGTRAELLRIKQVHVSGMDTEQVWQQARRILDAVVQEVEMEVPSEEESAEEELSAEDIAHEHAERYGSEDSLGEEGVDWHYDGEDAIDDDESSQGSLAEVGEEEDEDEAGTPLSELTDGEDGEGELPRDAIERTQVKDKHGLNDGFFSIDDFNKSTQFLENVDARGDANDGAASDEEDVDWGADPLDAASNAVASSDVVGGRRKPGGRRADEGLEEEEDDDEEGPTFGNVDLNAPDSDDDLSDVDQDADMDMDVGGLSNTNDILYADFFAPPARVGKPMTKAKAAVLEAKRARKSQSAGLANEDGTVQVDEMQRTMDEVHRDLFSDLSEQEEDEPEDAEAAQSSKNLSSHEKRQLALRAEIRALEAANLAAKPWALTGETVAPARPLNSLLEEDLDFERAGKPVPIVTAGVNESIEALIKRRIIARDFDEVPRRRPNEVNAATRRGRTDALELSDSKPGRGLAEEYEEDLLKRTDPNYVDARSEALKKKHEELDRAWKAIERQLDALTNWHYRPSAPSTDVSIRTDAPVVSMEDARPSVAGGADVGVSGLAPQEIYDVRSKDRAEGEVVTRGGTVVRKEEEGRDAKKRRRMREKERIKKGNAAKERETTAPKANGSKKGGRQDVEKQLKKAGVKVIDKKGAVRDVDGKSAKGIVQRSGGSLKL